MYSQNLFLQWDLCHKYDDNICLQEQKGVEVKVIQKELLLLNLLWVFVLQVGTILYFWVRISIHPTDYVMPQADCVKYNLLLKLAKGEYV